MIRRVIQFLSTKKNTEPSEDKKMTKLLACFWGFLLFNPILHEETYAAIINAQSCSQHDVQKAIDSASRGDTVNVPSGSCTWSTKTVVTKQITLQGAGIDSTTINCGDLKECIDMNVSADALSPLWRITGFTFTGGHAGNGIINIRGTGMNWRIDHNKFYNWQTFRAVDQLGGGYGVVDHNTFYKDTVAGAGSGVGVHVSESSNNDKGFASWQRPYVWGTADAVFIEDNSFTFYPNRIDEDKRYGWPTDG